MDTDWQANTQQIKPSNSGSSVGYPLFGNSAQTTDVDELLAESTDLLANPHTMSLSETCEYQGNYSSWAGLLLY